MFLLNSDIEYLIITIFLAFLFLTGLKMRQYDNCNIRDFVKDRVNLWFSIDYNFSSAIKGIACVLILMGHYRSFFLPISEDETLITMIIGMSSANIALFLFMFFGAPAKPCVCKYFDIDLESSIRSLIFAPSKR